jgi:hypothetical protein
VCRENVAMRSVCARAMLEATSVSLYTGVRFTLRARRLHSSQKRGVSSEAWGTQEIWRGKSGVFNAGYIGPFVAWKRMRAVESEE